MALSANFLLCTFLLAPSANAVTADNWNLSIDWSFPQALLLELQVQEALQQSVLSLAVAYHVSHLTYSMIKALCWDQEN